MGVPLRKTGKKILPADPFQTLDRASVGKLVEMGIKGGRSTNPNLKVGICGEHGGDPASVEFCHEVGMNYVSCSPFRVPIARLAAAQAAGGIIHQHHARRERPSLNSSSVISHIR